MKLSDRFSEALTFAAALHRDQTRKVSGEPYMAHLLGVASIALQFGADEDEAIAALLHDAIEDQGGPTAREEIHRRFGPRVTTIVEGCSDTDQTPKPPWRERKEAYLAHLAQASASDRLISACDKLHNMRSLLTDYRRLGDDLWQHFRGGRDGTLWYYRTLADEFRKRSVRPLLVDELDRVVTTMEDSAK